MEKIKLNCPCCGSPFKYHANSNEYVCSYCGSKTVINYNRKNINNVEFAKKEMKEYFYNGNYYKAYNMATELLNKYPNDEEINTIYNESHKMVIIQNKEKEKEAVLKRTRYLLDLFKRNNISELESYYTYHTYQETYSLIEAYYCAYPDEKEVVELYNYYNSLLFEKKKKIKDSEQAYNTIQALFWISIIFIMFISTVRRFFD